MLSSSRRIERAIAAVLVVLVVVVVIGNLFGPEVPRQDVVDATTDGVWEAAGVPADEVNRGSADRQTYRNTLACADLEQGDRWATISTSRVGPGRATQDAIVDGATSYLQDEGFTVSRYRSSGSETRQLVAANTADEQSIELFVEGDGTATLRILAGPCAALLAEPPDAPYVPDD